MTGARSERERRRRPAVVVRHEVDVDLTIRRARVPDRVVADPRPPCLGRREVLHVPEPRRRGRQSQRLLLVPGQEEAEPLVEPHGREVLDPLAADRDPHDRRAHPLRGDHLRGDDLHDGRLDHLEPGHDTPLLGKKARLT
ncbi:hypothetical protein D3C74_404590 [compost metagenome]